MILEKHQKLIKTMQNEKDFSGNVKNTHYFLRKVCKMMKINGNPWRTGNPLGLRKNVYQGKLVYPGTPFSALTPAAQRPAAAPPTARPLPGNRTRGRGESLLP